MSKKFFSLSLLVLCFVPVFAMAQRYTITDLGPLAPTGINSWAQVVGNYNGHAFLWARGQGMRDLGLLPTGTFSRAAAINDLGVVTGTADGPGTVISPIPDVPNQECDHLTQPFVWTLRTGMKGLGSTGIRGLFLSFNNCNYAFYGRDINNFGQVAGDVPGAPDLYAFPFSWTKTDGMTLLDGGSWPPSFGNGISNTGQIVGQSSDFFTMGIGHAMVWKAGVPSDLGTLGGGADGYGSSANGVNDVGLIVGWSTTSPITFYCCPLNSSPVHAILWTQSGIMRDLGTLAGDTSSAASKINLFGQVIGASGNTLDQWDESSALFEVVGRPFIWTERTSMRDLNTLIPQNSTWVLNSVADINIWGQIVGSGTRNGQPHGFLLTPLNPFRFEDAAPR
jgi:probable HAF family extracellular repeat protein